MNNQDYRNLIVTMVNKIDQKKFLVAIYTYIKTLLE